MYMFSCCSHCNLTLCIYSQEYHSPYACACLWESCFLGPAVCAHTPTYTKYRGNLSDLNPNRNFEQARHVCVWNMHIRTYVNTPIHIQAYVSLKYAHTHLCWNTRTHTSIPQDRGRSPVPDAWVSSLPQVRRPSAPHALFLCAFSPRPPPCVCVLED